MGYLRDFGAQLEAKLASLPEEARAEVIAFVKKEVLTSYRNGLRDAEGGRSSDERQERPAKRGRKSRQAPAKRRNYQQQ